MRLHGVPGERAARRAPPRQAPWRRRRRRGRLGLCPRRGPHGAGEQRAERVVLVGERSVAAPGRRRPDSKIATSPWPRARVVARDVEQRAEERRAQDRLVGGHRVLEHDELAQLVARRREQPIGRAPGSQNDQPTTSCRPWPASASSARRRRRCSRESAAGQRRCGLLAASPGSCVETVEPRDLLDQVGLARDVAAAPVRRASRRARRRRSVDAEAERARGSRRCARAAIGDAEQAADARVAQADRRLRRRSGRATDVDRAGHERRAGQLEHQPRRDRLRLERLLGRQALLEARRGLAAQPELRRRAVDVRPVPGRDLEQDARRRRPATSRARPPMTPASDVGPSSSAMRQTSASSVRSWSSSVVDRLAVARARARRAGRRRCGRGRRRAAAGRSAASRSS